MLSNSYCISEVLRKIETRASNFLNKRVGIQRFLNEGVDEMELTERFSNFNDLLSEYTIWNNDYDSHDGEYFDPDADY